MLNKWVVDYKNKHYKSDFEFWKKYFLLFWKNQCFAFVFDYPFLPKTSPTFQYNLDYNIYLGEIICVGRVWCLTRAEFRPRPAAAQSTPRHLKMSTKFRKIVLKSKIHRHVYSNNQGSVIVTVFKTTKLTYIVALRWPLVALRWPIVALRWPLWA